MFQLEQHAAPLEVTRKRDFLSFLGRLEAALHCDEHLRRSFFPLWKGDVADKVPTADDWQAFTMAFDAFLAKLPVIRLVAGLDDYASTQRPIPGSDGIIRLNATLARACTIHSPDPTFALCVCLASVLHELGHCFGLHVRPDPGGFSRIALSAASYEDCIPDSNEECRRVGQGGFVQETMLWGGVVSARVPITAAAGDFLLVEGLDIDTGNISVSIGVLLLSPSRRS
jgi:hypothetical protein